MINDEITENLLRSHHIQRVVLRHTQRKEVIG